MAEDIARHLLDQGLLRSDGAGARAARLVTETFVALGDGPRVEQMLRSYRERMATRARGASLLSALDPDPRTSLLPDGRLDAVALSRRLQTGDILPNGILDVLAEHRRELARNPQLRLLNVTAFRREDPAFACRQLNRFLGGCGPATVERLAGEGQFLAGIRFATIQQYRHGPSVSVLMSAFNAEETIAFAVDSILGQSHANLELLVCDDGSTDRTPEILSERYGDEPRVRLFRSSENQGTYNIRNALIEEASCDLVTVHDADDLALPTRIERQVAAMRTSGAEACIANWMRVTPEGRFIFFRDQCAVRLSIVSLMARREVFARMGPYRSVRYAADYEFHRSLVDAHAAGAVVRIREPLIFGLWSESSMTRTSGAEALENGFRSPGRRLYTELVLRQRLFGEEGIGDDDVDALLREAGNYAQSSELVPLSSDSAEAGSRVGTGVVRSS